MKLFNRFPASQKRWAVQSPEHRRLQIQESFCRMQYSLFTHGTALEIETPDALAGSIKVGWGTQILFRAPVAENVEGLPVFPEVGPGSWFHMPLPSTLTTFGRRNPRLESVTPLFESRHCRILHVHVSDGVDILQEFNNLKLAGSFLLDLRKVR